jgi:alkylation response protein AidB-like acyl-CoA dehydrogenase
MVDSTGIDASAGDAWAERGRALSHEVVERIRDAASYFRDASPEAEALGRLPDETVRRMRDIGVVRMLQPEEFGGYEADPCAFLEAVMLLSSLCGAAGWVGGIVGVHAFEMGASDHGLQQEVWGDDPDTWIASPYMPNGRARPVGGGYVFSGRWPFSSGTDHCSWVFLGGVVTDQDGSTARPVDIRHFVLPRADYEIIDGSWDVWGLKGTGSKDVVVRDAFVPEYRAVSSRRVMDGDLAREVRPDSAVYRVPWSAVFPSSITAAIIGMAEGALAIHTATERDRVSARKTKMSEDPWALSSIGEAASEIASCRAQLLANVGEMYGIASRGDTVPFELRAQGRRDQVRTSWRAVGALDQIFARSGGNSVRTDGALQRLWRDAHAGLQHVINVYGPIYQAYAQVAIGREVDQYVALTI